MELTLNIDEKEFTELLNGELKNFSEQELHEICRQGLLKILSDPNQFKDLFVTRDSYYSSSNSYHATEILKKAAETVNLDPLFEDFQEKVKEYLKENHDVIIKNLITDIFMSGFTKFLYNSQFIESLRANFSADLFASKESIKQEIRSEFHNRLG